MMDISQDQFKQRPIAYFCAEYALDPNLHIYAGGLGILAGDHVREAADQHLPLVGVGLFYDADITVKLEEVLDAQGSPLRVDIPIQDRLVKAQAFIYRVKDIPVYLLSTNIADNDAADQQITHKLYVADKELRLKQELVLGIGGLRLLEALAIHPSVYHLNEGHSAFLALELIRHEMREQKVTFDEAVELAKKRIVFTNHTLVAAGREVYSDDLVSLLLTGYAQELGVPVADVVKLGLVQESSSFSMTILSLRMASKVNAVSKLHAKKASDIWTDHPMIAITNGIHIPTWDKVQEISNHAFRKQELLNYITEKTQVTWASNQLLLGWGRRFVEYKRPLAILEDVQRFISITRKADKPVKIVFSGEPHESDIHGQELVRKLQQLIKEQLSDCVVYLDNYDMNVAEKMITGCDVWLNTPIVGFEACGTSGMKAALNGTLPCSTRDGWVDEVELFRIGWLLDNDHLSENILDTLEHEIIPMYYQNQSEWQQHMQNARALIMNEFSTTRMVTEYIEKMYQQHEGS